MNQAPTILSCGFDKLILIFQKVGLINQAPTILFCGFDKLILIFQKVGLMNQAPTEKQSPYII
jgi:hypothetical protein